MDEAREPPTRLSCTEGKKKEAGIGGQKAEAWMDCGWLENVHF